MSKIYNKYIELKNSPNYKENTLYLFKSGLFFIFIDKDAKKISNLLNLKLSYLTENIVKCGFPVQSLQKYINLLKETSYNIEIILPNYKETVSYDNYVNDENIKIVIDEILKINIDKLSISQAYDFLYYIQNKLNSIIG